MRTLTLGLLAIALSTRALAQTQVGDFQYQVNSDGATATISAYVGSGGTVDIPTEIAGFTVTAIGEDAFNEDLGSRSISSLVIPDSVVILDQYALQGAYTLANITIGSGVTNIGYDPFSDCVFSLTEISVSPQNGYYSSSNGVLFDKYQTTLVAYPHKLPVSTFAVPATVTDIADFAFQYSSSLAEILLPNELTNIGLGAFYGCSSLTNLILPSGVTSIQEKTFNGCSSLTNFIIPDTITNIGSDAFEACTSLGSIILPFGITAIADMTFDNCTRLTNIVIPPTVTNIGWIAFYHCWGLTSVEIPDSVTNIGPDAFSLCSALTNIIFGRGLISIAPYAFQYCSSLTEILFTGNAPSADPTSFGSPNVAFYMPGTTGWSTFSTTTGIPSILWNPAPVTNSFSVSDKSFAFNITGSRNIPVTIEASTNLTNPFWLPLQSTKLTNGLYSFSDPQWTNFTARYYRFSFR